MVAARANRSCLGGLIRIGGALLLCFATLRGAHPPPPLLRAGDVVAFVGGEDAAALAEQGYLEFLLLRTLPAARITFRSLAWEGDTAFAQSRELNYPTIEQQLEAVAATVVVVQFGQMESLAGPEKLPAFSAAFEQLLDRLAAGRSRRVIVLGPTPPRPGSPAASRFKAFADYAEETQRVAHRRGLPWVAPGEEETGLAPAHYRADGIHLNEPGQRQVALRLARSLGGALPGLGLTPAEETRLLRAIRDKNRLWFHYARPQNWAFLNGDRTVQPSSRDHLDPERRWFPEEMKEWLPLLAAREEQIWRLAGAPAAP